MLPRRRRLIRRYTLVSSLLVLAVSAYAVRAHLQERGSPADLAAVEGITDELGRTLPSDYPRVHFRDVTAEAGIAFHHFSGERGSLLPEDMGSGAAWGDYDGDGDDDLFLVNFAGPIANPARSLRDGGSSRLYRNQGDGTFADVTAAAGLARTGFFLGAFFGDYDGDGDLDLYLTAWGPNVLYRNHGDGTFEDVTAAAGVGDPRWSAGAAWGDYDNDGRIDLYVCSYVDFHAEGTGRGDTVAQYGYAIPYTLNPAAYDPLPNALYHNNGDGSFTDVALRLGVTDPEGRSLGAVFADLDDDGWLDLYVADDVSKNALFHNRGDGTFEDTSASSLAADYRGAMGLGVGDYDGDGDLDVFITHWIAQENALYQNALRGSPSTGRLQFFDVADQVGLGAPGLNRVSWGTSFFDYDNDGRPDLFVVNGHTFEDQADHRRLVPQRMQLFWNQHPDGFFDVSQASGEALARELVGRGAAFSDYDQDGDLDLVVTTNGGPPMLLRNDGGNRNHGLGIELRGHASNRRGLGARVRLRAGGHTQIAQVGSQGPYLSQDSLVLHFGLGAAERADEVEVLWPSGQVDRIHDLAAGRVHIIEEGGAREERPYR